MSTNNSLLPKEAVALVQHIELNRAGWWKKSIHRLVLAAVWLSDQPPNAEAIQVAMKATFRLPLSTQHLASALASLESQMLLIRLPNDTYRIPEEKRVSFENEIAEAEKVEREARASFCKLVADIGEDLEPDKVWTAFEHEFLGPLVKQVGVNAYRLIAGETMAVDKALVDHFLKPFPPDVHAKLRMLVTTFIDPKKPEVCAYISRILHARFCVEASGLPEHVLGKLNASIGKHIHFLMFVDTNFLFSLLELHENPSNAAAQELRELVTQLKGSLRIDLVITPDTIEEAKTSIGYTKGQLSGLPSGNNFAQAALQARFSGMAVKFLTERIRRNGKLTADEWFDPYLSDFVPIARSKGVELFNEKLDGYSTRQDVVDDILDVRKFEERLPENRRKSYQKVAHDMVLWHFVSDKRTAYVESPIDAKYWILTVDFRLIGFDEHKRNHSMSKVPLCIHPTSLIQLLQFWVPRTKEFEEAMLGSLRLPFLFQDFDAEGEKTSLTILKRIGRFEGSEGLSQDTITHVMLNDGLRSRLQSEHSEEGEIALVRDALVEEMRLRAEAEAEKAKVLEEAVIQRDTELATLAAQRFALEQDHAYAKQQKEDVENLAKLALASQGAELDVLKSKVLAMEVAEKERAEADALRKTDVEKGKALRVYLALLVAVSLASVLSGWGLASIDLLLVPLVGIGATRGLISVVVFVFCHLAIELSVGRSAPMSALWPFKQVSRFRRWLWSLVILGFVLGVIGNLVANQIQHNLDNQTASPASLPNTATPKQQ
jgi:hypothetical protein